MSTSTSKGFLNYILYCSFFQVLGYHNRVAVQPRERVDAPKAR